MFRLGSLGNTGVGVREAFWERSGSGGLRKGEGRTGGKSQGEAEPPGRLQRRPQPCAREAEPAEAPVCRRDGWSLSSREPLSVALGLRLRASALLGVFAAVPKRPRPTRPLPAAFPTLGEAEVFVTEGSLGRTSRHPTKGAQRVKCALGVAAK